MVVSQYLTKRAWSAGIVLLVGCDAATAGNLLTMATLGSHHMMVTVKDDLYFKTSSLTYGAQRASLVVGVHIGLSQVPTCKGLIAT